MAVGKGPKTAAFVAQLRHDAIRFFHDDPGKLQGYLEDLERIAKDDQQPGAVRVAAYKELLARGLGSPDLAITVNHAEAEEPVSFDAESHGRRLLALGVEWERLPLNCQAAIPRPIDATVDGP